MLITSIVKFHCDWRKTRRTQRRPHRDYSGHNFSLASCQWTIIQPGVIAKLKFLWSRWRNRDLSIFMQRKQPLFKKFVFSKYHFWLPPGYVPDHPHTHPTNKFFLSVEIEANKRSMGLQGSADLQDWCEAGPRETKNVSMFNCPSNFAFRITRFVLDTCSLTSKINKAPQGYQNAER